ncbi:pentapeptide repeat-containing protein [Paenibacillus sp. GYB003]
MIGADFFQSAFQEIRFAECRIDQANLSGCKLEGIDLSD